MTAIGLETAVGIACHPSVTRHPDRDHAGRRGLARRGGRHDAAAVKR